MIRTRRLLATLSRLLLNREERELASIQRKDIVLSLAQSNKKDESEEQSSETQAMKNFMQAGSLAKTEAALQSIHNLTQIDKLRLGVIFSSWS